MDKFVVRVPKADRLKQEPKHERNYKQAKLESLRVSLVLYCIVLYCASYLCSINCILIEIPIVFQESGCH